MLHSGKAGLYRVVICLGNRVEFMIMAPRASHSQPEKSATGGTHHVVQFIGTLRCGQNGVRAFDLVPGASNQKARRSILAEEISGELLENEAIIRLILVESLNDIIAIKPGRWARIIHLKPV